MPYIPAGARKEALDHKDPLLEGLSAQTAELLQVDGARISTLIIQRAEATEPAVLVLYFQGLSPFLSTL